MPWTTKLSLGGGGGGGGERESVGEARKRHFSFYTCMVKNWLLFEKIVDFPQKSSFHYPFSSQIYKKLFFGSITIVRTFAILQFKICYFTV